MCTSPVRTEWDSTKASNFIKGIQHSYLLSNLLSCRCPGSLYGGCHMRQVVPLVRPTIPFRIQQHTLSIPQPAADPPGPTHKGSHVRPSC